MTQNSTPAPLPIPDEVEILKNYTADPNCKACHGKGRIGINHLFDKQRGSFYQLQFCHCLKPVESEYMRLEKMIKLLKEEIEIRDQAIKAMILSRTKELYRVSFFGGILTKWDSICIWWQSIVDRVKNLMPWKGEGKG